MPLNLIICWALSYNQYFHILATFTFSTAPPTPSIEETEGTVEVEIRDLNIDEVLFQLPLFCTILFEQKRVIERNDKTHKPSRGGFLYFLKYIGARITWMKLSHSRLLARKLLSLLIQLYDSNWSFLWYPGCYWKMLRRCPCGYFVRR